jgi:multiple sugar transport system permease protein
MMRCGKRMRKVIVYAFLTGFAVLFLIPLFWMVSTSFKPDEEVMIVKWIPSRLEWQNYVKAVRAFPFFKYLRNTVFLTVVNTIGTVLTGSLVAYGFAKLRWKGRKALFLVTIATMFIPGQVLIIPVYIMYSKIGWVNTYLPLIVPCFLGGGAFTIFMLRQFFVSLPDEIIESARLDGASELTIFTRIVLPISTPALITVSVFTVLFVWNDFFGPLIYLHKSDMWTLSIGLRAFQQRYSTQWNLLMAASTIMSIPMIVLYFFLQEKIVRGFTLRGGIH